MDQIKKNNIAYGKLLNKCWEDAAYLEKFRADPAAALKEHGIPTPSNARYHIVDPKDLKPSTNEDVYLFYTAKPDVTSLSDKSLDAVAGGDKDVSAVVLAIDPFPVPDTTSLTTNIDLTVVIAAVGVG